MAKREPTSPLVRRLVNQIARALRNRPERIVGVGLAERPSTRDSTNDHLSRSVRMRDSKRRLSRLLWDPYEQSRLRRYQEYREMLEEVPELERSLKVLRDFIFSGASEDNRKPKSFNLTFGQGARSALKALVDRAVTVHGLHTWVEEVMFEGLHLGDSMTEIVYEGDTFALKSLLYLRPDTTSVWTDEQGRGATTLYVVNSTDDAFSGESRLLHPFQIVHYAPDRLRGNSYGRSTFASLRKNRRNSDAIGDVMVMLALRKAAGDEKIFWPFPGEMAEEPLWDFIEKIRTALDANYHFDGEGDLRKRAVADLETEPGVVPYRIIPESNAKPEVIHGPEAKLEQLIAALQHLQEVYPIGTTVPPSFMGIERNVNSKATVEHEGKAFSLTIARKQRDAAGLAVEVLNRSLLVAGVIPESEEYEISLPRPAQFDEELRAEVIRLRATAAGLLMQSGFPLDFVARWALGLGIEEAEAVLEQSGLVKRIDGRKPGKSGNGDGQYKDEIGDNSGGGLSKMLGEIASLEAALEPTKVDGASGVEGLVEAFVEWRGNGGGP